MGVRSRIGTEIATGVTEPPAPRPAWLRRGRLDLVFAADTVTALILFLVTNNVLTNSQHSGVHNAGLIALDSVVLCAPLVLRTRYPLTAWTMSTLAMLFASWTATAFSVLPDKYAIPGIIVYLLCLYAVAVRCKAWVVATASAVTVIGSIVVQSRTLLTAIFLGAIAVFAGIIVRYRRGSREQLAVVERRHEGERALLEERQRIARELHDVVAHHMSVIAIQAEAAPYKIADPPPELVESFADIRASALSGLNELRRVLGVLRSDRAEVAPQPGLEDLDTLLESARTGGVTVTSGVTGTPRPIPEGVNLSAYRIVQEALSNAMRHAPGSAVQVRLFYGEAALVIEIRNTGGSLPEDQPGGAELAMKGASEWGMGRGTGGGGHGIIGMRERATMLGGHLEAGPTPGNEFLVTAALPLGTNPSEGDTGPEEAA